MKNVINPSLPTKLNFISLLAHRMQHPKRSKKFCLGFLIPFGFDVFAIKPNFVARSIAFGLYGLIVVSFLEFLGMLEVFSADSHQFFELVC